jgi:hypothetical protein
MDNADFRRTVRRFFRRYVAARVSFPKATGNLYELFVYTLVCESIQQAGCALRLRTPVPGEFHFRSSPGGISSAYSYYAFNGPSGSLYELRNGIEVYGHSMMRHESDISIFRVNPGSAAPQAVHTELVLSIECKCYSSATSLKGEARKNAGMVQDWSATAHASKSAGRPQGCIHCGLHFLPKFVTNVRHGTRKDIEQYLDAYDLGPEFGVVPRAAAVRQFKTVLTQSITNL